MNELISQRIPRALTLTSRANPLVASLAILEQAKHRREQGLFLAEGVKLSAEAAGLPEVRYVLLMSDDGRADSALIDIAAAAPAGASVVVLPSSTFAKISTENAPQGIITVLSRMESLHRVWDGVSAVFSGEEDVSVFRSERFAKVA